MRHAAKLLPFLALYAAVVLLAQSAPARDELKYLAFAGNVLHGQWSPSDDLNLWFGPGYPAVLAPFVAAGAPLVAARLLNALLVFAGLLYFHAAAKLHLSERTALWATCALGLYPPLLRHLHVLMSEALAIFLACGLVFHVCALLRRTERRWGAAAAAACYLAALALTKPVYGYTILAGVGGCGILWAVRRTIAWRSMLLVHLSALGLCVPYLLHTYAVSGRPFYWASSGGLSFYWMATSRGDDLGDWHDARSPVDVGTLPDEHRAVLASLETLGVVERDGALWQAGLRHVLANPAGYARNWLANLGRLLFNYPFSGTPQKLSTYFYALPNMVLVVLALLCVVPTLARRRSLPAELVAVLAFALVSLGGMSLVSAYARFLVPMVPILVLWIAFTATRLITVRLSD